VAHLTKILGGPPMPSSIIYVTQKRCISTLRFAICIHYDFQEVADVNVGLLADHAVVRRRLRLPGRRSHERVMLHVGWSIGCQSTSRRPVQLLTLSPPLPRRRRLRTISSSSRRLTAWRVDLSGRRSFSHRQTNAGITLVRCLVFVYSK